MSSFTKKVDFEVDVIYQQRKNRPIIYYNLSKCMHCALEFMMHNDDLIIKRAHKAVASCLAKR